MLSPEAIGDIRSYFFKAIVELFSGYYDCIGKDEDGDTIFLIYKFIEMRPDSYKLFYKSFFQHNLERLEHFGFMEFLNLQDEGANDSELAARKEIFDSCAEIMQHTKRHFRDDENTDEVWGGTAAADDSEGTQSIYKLWPSKKTDKEIADLYLGGHYSTDTYLANKLGSSPIPVPTSKPTAADGACSEEEEKKSHGGGSDGEEVEKEGFDMA